MKTYFIGNELFNEFLPATLDDVISYCKNKDVLGIDIETSRKYSRKYKEDVYKAGLDPFLSRVVMLQIGDLENRFVIDTRSVNPTPLLQTLEREDLTLVGHNLIFEYSHLLVSYGIRLRKVWDTMIVDLILHNGLNIKYSLEELAKRYLNVVTPVELNLFSKEDLKELGSIVRKGNKEDYEEAEIDDDKITAFEENMQFYIDKSIRMGFVNIGDKPFTKRQIEYGGDDITMPLLIRKKQLQGRILNTGEEYCPTRCFNLENEFLLVLGDMKVHGMPFDGVKWMEIYREALPKYDALRQWCDEYVAKHVPSLVTAGSLFDEVATKTIDWTSPKQAVQVGRQLGIAVQERSKSTGKIEWTMGAKAMEKLLKKNPPHKEFIEKYLELKEYQLKVTTFGKDYLKYVHPITGRIHPSFRQILNTGRMAANKPNNSQLPGSGDYRKCFTQKGRKIIGCDYSSQEVFVLANLAEDFNMIEMLNTPGLDFHAATATKMFRLIDKDPSLEITKETTKNTDSPLYNPEHAAKRQAAKIVNFQTPYGASAKSIAESTGLTDEEGEMLYNSYYESFPEVNTHFSERHKHILQHGWIQIDPLLDRRYFYPTFREWQRLKEKIFSVYPKDYRFLPQEAKEEVKALAKEKYGEEMKLSRMMEGQMKRRAQNYEIQGSSAGITKTACILIRREMLRNNWYGKYGIMNIVHDEVDGDAITEEAEFWGKVITDNMKKAGLYWCKYALLSAEAKISDYWEH